MITNEIHAILNQAEKILKYKQAATPEKPYEQEDAILHGMIAYSELENGEKYFGLCPARKAHFYMFWDRNSNLFFVPDNGSRLTAKYFDGFIPMLSETSQKGSIPLNKEEAEKNYAKAIKEISEAFKAKQEAEKRYNEAQVQLGIHRGRFEKLLLT